MGGPTEGRFTIPRSPLIKRQFTKLSENLAGGKVPFYRECVFFRTQLRSVPKAEHAGQSMEASHEDEVCNVSTFVVAPGKSEEGTALLEALASVIVRQLPVMPVEYIRKIVFDSYDYFFTLFS